MFRDKAVFVRIRGYRENEVIRLVRKKNYTK